VVVQIVAVWAWGVEPARRSLEEVEQVPDPAGGAPRTAQA
jgi:hypothetical protein